MIFRGKDHFLVPQKQYGFNGHNFKYKSSIQYLNDLIFQVGDEKIILTWGALPRDLDLHLYICDQCEVFYNVRNCLGANLDADMTNGFGPETITIDNTQYIDTTYVLFAFDFVPDSTVPLINSGGKIELRPIGQPSVTINVPTTSQTTSDGFWIMGKNLLFFTIT